MHDNITIFLDSDNLHGNSKWEIKGNVRFTLKTLFIKNNTRHNIFRNSRNNLKNIFFNVKESFLFCEKR